VTTWSQLFFGRPEQVRQARRFVGAVLEDLTCRESALLVVSELATNAVVHTDSGKPDGWFIVHVVVFVDRVRLRVFDMGHPTNKPELKPLDPDAHTGRGLAVVAGLALDWGVEGDQSAYLVWADLHEPGRRKYW
jgi:anti-sigma regulatory factor (Ser/Thr protein kinase)